MPKIPSMTKLKRGGKKTCWMWFVFPQVIGLGRTPVAEKYSIKSIEEAKAYIAHPVLWAPTIQRSQRSITSIHHIPSRGQVYV